jgi:hypothetical protein
MMHRKLPLAILGAASALALSLAPSAALAGSHHGHHHRHGHNLIRADLTPSLPDDAAINGVPPGGAPWILQRGSVRVRDNGRIDVRIQGLQIPSDEGAANPVASIDAVLYCGGMEVARTQPHDMSTPGGDARFREFLTVPETCDSATVLISPVGPDGPFPVYIASAMAMADDDD